VETLVTYKPVQVTCGNNHTLALMRKDFLSENLGNGEAFGWGNNENGQCGTGRDPF